MTGHHNLSSLIWGFADLLYNHIEAANYHKVILPLTLLRRFDCVLTDTQVGGRPAKEVLVDLAREHQNLRTGTPQDRELFQMIVTSTTKLTFYNVSGFDFKALADSLIRQCAPCSRTSWA